MDSCDSIRVMKRNPDCSFVVAFSCKIVFYDFGSIGKHISPPCSTWTTCFDYNAMPTKLIISVKSSNYESVALSESWEMIEVMIWLLPWGCSLHQDLMASVLLDYTTSFSFIKPMDTFFIRSRRLKFSLCERSIAYHRLSVYAKSLC